ncbi:FUSC family protein [Kitasatospora sp. NPDC048540]|uniref:FUSC family protein n=1 Tax=Kitasatospora sp. NPDC048540 TaxID=3155634 RepID=UPI0033C9D33B
MPSSPPPPSAGPGHRLRAGAAAAARALSPRGALALGRGDGSLLFAARAALAMALVAAPLVAAGRPALAPYAMLGSFTTTFGRGMPYPRRARVLAVVALAMTACVGCGSALAAGADPQAGGAGAALVVVATAVVAALAKLVCDATRLGGLGAVLLLFAFAVAANGSPAWSEVGPHTALAAAGAAVAWGLALAGWFWRPDRPERFAVAAALRELAALVDDLGAGVTGGRSRHRATAAVVEAYHCLGLAPPVAGVREERGGVYVRLADFSWSLLISSAGRAPDGCAALAGTLRRQVRLLGDRRGRGPVLLPELSPPAPDGAARDPAGAGAAADALAARRAAELVRRRPTGSGRLAVVAVPALRMLVGTGLAGALAVALGLGHGYWAAISAAAVLHSVNVRTTAQRAVQRTLGTFAGLLLALALLAAHPAAAVLVGLVVVLEFLLEAVVVRNYALGVVFLTPLALLLSDLAAPAPAGELVRDRALGSVLGIVVGLGCALVVVHGHASVRVERALAVCAQTAERAERALAGRAGVPVLLVQVQLAVAVVELREAGDAAAGELWSAGIDTAALAAAEQRAYLLLARLAGPH